MDIQEVATTRIRFTLTPDRITLKLNDEARRNPDMQRRLLAMGETLRLYQPNITQSYRGRVNTRGEKYILSMATNRNKYRSAELVLVEGGAVSLVPPSTPGRSAEPSPPPPTH